MRRLDKLHQFRPRTYDSSQPMYAPDRDVAMVVSGALGDMQIAYLAGRFEPWLKVFAPLLENSGDTATPAEAIEAAAGRFSVFLARASGKQLDENGQPLTMEQKQLQLVADFADAVRDFVSPSPAASFFMAAMFGYMMMDYYFFCVRQSQELGPMHSLYLDTFNDLVSRQANGIRLQELPGDTLSRELRQVVRLMMESGMTGKQIELAVQEQVAKCMTSR